MGNLNLFRLIPAAHLRELRARCRLAVKLVCRSKCIRHRGLDPPVVLVVEVPHVVVDDRHEVGDEIFFRISQNALVSSLISRTRFLIGALFARRLAASTLVDRWRVCPSLGG
jgi:hypothetical protein